MNNKGKAKAIRDFYAQRQTSSNIYNMKVNMKLLNKKLSTIKDIDKYLDEQYKELGIKRFASKSDMMQYIVDTGNINNVRMYQKTIDQRWKEYLHREDLIITGQYQYYKKNYYKTNYIAKLAEAGIDDDIIRALQELSEEEWASLASLRASDRDNPGNYALPMIDTYYDVEGIQGDKDYKSSLEEDIKNAYKKVLGKDINENVIEVTNRELVWTDNTDYTYFAYNNESKIAKLLRKVPRKLRYKIERNGNFEIDNNTYSTEKEARFATIELMEKHGSAKMRTTKRGTQYYPFYLNRNETAEYIAWKHNKRGK